MARQIDREMAEKDRLITMLALSKGIESWIDRLVACICVGDHVLGRFGKIDSLMS